MDLINVVTITTLLSVTNLCWSSNSTHRGLLPVLDIARLEAPSPGSCRDDLLSLRRGLDSQQPWAITMWDSSVKAPVGLTSLTAVQFGDFDQCLSVSTPVTPQYCLVDFEGNFTLWSKFQWAVCVPASCSARELQTSVQNYMDFEDAGVNVQLRSFACTTKDTTSSTFSFGDVIYSVVIVTLVGGAVAATIYDLTVRPEYDGFSCPSTAIQCFSMRYGWHSLFRSNEQISGVNLSALHGLHTLAFFFIVLGHHYAVETLFMSITNYLSVENMFLNSWFAPAACHVDLFVDMFFCMSAFLMAFLYMSQLEKRFVSPLKVYMNRIVRLIPAYALVVFFNATLYRHLGDGPMWKTLTEDERKLCSTQWWTNLLFINTYVNVEQMCMGQSWFISCDFQMFVVGVLLVFMLHKNLPVGSLVVAFVFAASTLSAFLGTYLHNRPGIMLFTKDFTSDPRHHDVFNSVYTQGHYRGTSYLPGLLAGVYVFKRKRNSFSKSTTRFLQVVGLTIVLSVWWSGAIFYNSDRRPNQFWTSVYAATFHSAFGVGFSILITSFVLGKSTLLSQVFSWRGFVPFSRLSYCIYLVHFGLQVFWVASLRSPTYISPSKLVSSTIGDVAISMVISLVMNLTVESPVRYLAKFLTDVPATESQEKSKETKLFLSKCCEDIQPMKK